MRQLRDFRFLTSLLHALSKVDFVEKVDLRSEVFILKGRAVLRNNRFLQIYFNELTGTTSVALIEEDNRRWGIDLARQCLFWVRHGIIVGQRQRMSDG